MSGTTVENCWSNRSSMPFYSEEMNSVGVSNTMWVSIRVRHHAALVVHNCLSSNRPRGDENTPRTRRIDIVRGPVGALWHSRGCNAHETGESWGGVLGQEGAVVRPLVFAFVRHHGVHPVDLGPWEGEGGGGGGGGGLWMFPGAGVQGSIKRPCENAYYKNIQKYVSGADGGRGGGLEPPDAVCRVRENVVRKYAIRILNNDCEMIQNVRVEKRDATKKFKTF